MKHLVLATLSLLLPLGCAFAQDASWTGEGSFSAGVTTGNTETTDLGLGLDLSRETTLWTTTLEALADFGETDGTETKNRFFLAGQLDRQINDRLYGFGRASYEQDEFSGFETRTFVGGGLGYDVLTGPRQTWAIEGGPGLKIDEVRETTDGTTVIPAETVESFSVFAASAYAFQFNDNVAFTNDTNLLYAEESTQIVNTAAITASLTDALSARFSFDVRHDTDPPLGFESTDTATRISLVYAIG